MKATECLNAEHGVFLTQLDYLEKMLNDKASIEAVRAVVLSIAAAVDKHRDFEEAFLYPAIQRYLGGNFPPVQIMEDEHRGIELCIKGVANGQNDTRELARNFIHILRQHIAKEINVLFPMAEQAIPAAELEQMACQCAERDAAHLPAQSGHGCCSH